MEYFNLTKKESLAAKLLLRLQEDENKHIKDNMYNRVLKFIIFKVIKPNANEMIRAMDYFIKHPEAIETLEKKREELRNRA